MFGLAPIDVKSNFYPDNVSEVALLLYLENNLVDFGRWTGETTITERECRLVHTQHYSDSVAKDLPEQFPDLLVVRIQHTDTADSAP